MFRNCILLLLPFFGWSQIPQGYYDPADGKEGSELLDALSQIIENPNTVSYGSVDEKFVEIGSDEDPNNSNNIIYFYTRDSRASSNFSGNGNGSESSGAWNKEHVWPRSRGVGDSGDDQQDMHMLRPTDVDVNSRRGNLDFGKVSGNNTSNSTYFEPHDEVKGDVARILLYMVTCYRGSIDLVETVSNSATQLGNLSLMLQWHEDDPVDDFEESRNDKVYDVQGNRNPYVDHPEWVDCIWGNNCQETSDPVLDVLEQDDVKLFPNPASGFIKLKNLPKSSQVRVFDSFGYNMQLRLEEDRIKVSELSNGLYFLIISGKEPKVIKFRVH